MNWILIGACILVAVAVLIEVAVAPGRLTGEAKKTSEIFYGLNCAHRGLYTKDQKIPENSIAAFKAARDKGYGVELDVHITTDGQLAVFHDYDLKRVCGVDGQIQATDYGRLSELRLFGTDEKIPLLTEVLELLGDTPVIVEIKPAGPRNALICQKTLEILRSHGQNWCIQSFDPRICAWFKKNAPDVLRGQLSCPPREYVGISWVSSIIIGNLLLNIIARPHYIAYKNNPYPMVVKVCMIMKPMKAVWTVNGGHDIKKAEGDNDIVIFEHYEPETPRFK